MIDRPAVEAAAALLASDTLIGSQVGPYRIEVLLGAGGMGEVYRATDTVLGRQVAIKMLPAVLAADPERFETRSPARLQPAGRAFTDKAKCTSCHNEYIPGIAVALARQRGIAVNEPLAAHSIAMTQANWQRRRDLATLGETAPPTGVPPGLAYGLLEFSAAGLGPSALTDAMVIALANRQSDDRS